MRSLFLLLLFTSSTLRSSAFVSPQPHSLSVSSKKQQQAAERRSTTALIVAAASAGDIDYNVVSLVVGQENYGLAVVCLGEAIWSFAQAPSLGNAVRVFVPTTLAAIILVAVSGPMVTSTDPGQIGAGLSIATAVSLGLGASYILRLMAPFSPAPKEIAAVGLLVSVAGLFSFTQNLVVDGFISLPSLPSLPMPTETDFGF